MTTTFFYDSFQLARDFNPDYTSSNSSEDDPFVEGVRAVLDRYSPPEPIFTPTLITLAEFNTPEGFSNQYTGTFEQSEDGTISGTITGISGHFASLVVTTVFSGSEVFSDLHNSQNALTRPGFESSPIQVSQLHETLFMIRDLDLDFETFFGMLTTPLDVMPTATIESFLFSGDDSLHSAALEQFEGNIEINGYDGNDRISGSKYFDDFLQGGEGNDSLWSRDGNDTLFGDAGDDSVYGGDGNDSLFGGVGDDSLISGDGTDILDGGDGDDGLFGHFGNNLFIGGKGDDELIGSHRNLGVYEGYATAQFAGTADSYTIVLSGGGPHSPNTITDRVADRDGTDTFLRIQQLDFLDRSITLDLVGSDLSLESSQMGEIATLYTAYFDRAPDALGLYFWVEQARSGMSLEEMSGYFSQSDEAQSMFAFNGSTELFVTTVYENVLNRVPDTDGLAFWAGVLNSGALPRSSFILDVIRGALTTPMAEETAEMAAQRAADVTYLENTAELGLYFAKDKGMTNVENAYAVFDIFDGTVAGLIASRNAVDAFYEAAIDPTDGELVVQMTGFLDDPNFFEL